MLSVLLLKRNKPVEKFIFTAQQLTSAQQLHTVQDVVFHTGHKESTAQCCRQYRSKEAPPSLCAVVTHHVVQQPGNETNKKHYSFSAQQFDDLYIILKKIVKNVQSNFKKKKRLMPACLATWQFLLLLASERKRGKESQNLLEGFGIVFSMVVFFSHLHHCQGKKLELSMAKWLLAGNCKSQFVHNNIIYRSIYYSYNVSIAFIY